MRRVVGLKQALVGYIHSQQAGWIYVLRVLHGKFSEWLFEKKVYRLSMNSCKEKKIIATAFAGKVYGDNPRYIVEKIHELSPDVEIVWLCSTLCSANVPPYIRTISFHDQTTVIK